MNIEKERESFEQFCIKDDEFCIHRYAGDPNYSDDYTQCAWLAWLASANREGYKLVPKYHQENIRDALIIACDIKDDEQRFEDSLNYVHKAMIGACDDH